MRLRPRAWLSQIVPYRPGSHATGQDGSMASNESPLGCSPAVASAVTDAMSAAHRYPDPLADELRAEIAARHGCSPEQVLVGNGSDELIFLLALAFLADGGHAVCADPPYRIDEISAYAVNARLTRVPLRDWAHDLDAMAAVDADIAYVVNPHNPTGTTRSLADIRRFVEQSPAGLVVVDEAYVDFADDPDVGSADALLGDPRVAVLRTFSKIHGLAGLRVGYLLADPTLVATLRKIRAPFSVGAAAQAGALASLRDPAHAARVRSHTLAVRDEMVRLLHAAGVATVPTQANFVLVLAPDGRAPDGRDEAGLVALLADHGIAVRPGSALGLPGTVRISIPTAAGLDLLRTALGHLPASAPARA